MNPLKIVEKITNEIIQHLSLTHLAYPFIKNMIIWVYVAGWEKGISYKKGNTPVIKMDKYGKILDTYESISDAAKKNQLHAQGINAVCKGRAHTHGRFCWKYIEDQKQIREITEGWQNKL